MSSNGNLAVLVIIPIGIVGIGIAVIFYLCIQRRRSRRGKRKSFVYLIRIPTHYTQYYTIIYFYRGKYDGLAPRGKQYSPSPKGEVNIAS